MKHLVAITFFALAIAARAETVTIDANANKHSIDPRIYGVAFADSASLSDLNAPLNRSGGNTTSRYNWQQNCSNHANDWYYESLDDGSPTAGNTGDSFITTSKAGGAQPMITIPMIGWVAKLGASRARLCSFSIAKYGAQQGNDSQYFPDAGNGVLSSGANVTGNDPNDANVPADSTFQQGWVQHLLTTWNNAANGGVRYYLLDNEHSIWQGTHRDVHPIGATMDEIQTKMVQYATMIKNLDPGVTVMGPEEWGWDGYLYSGYDQQYAAAHGWTSFPDRAAHGNMDYMPWLLQQMQAAETTAGKRLLDVFSLHYYPQGGEYSDDTSAATVALRNKSTRSLWDPTYVDQSWIGTQVYLIPRMKTWVSQNYPNTQIAISEYNWGAESDINGATTQADIYGIFGREGLNMATRWTTPANNTPTYLAMKMYRNYDGSKSTFGDNSISTTVTQPDNLSAFSAIRSNDGAMTVMVINKVGSASALTLNLANFTGGSSAQVWQLTSSNAITHLSNVSVSSNSISTNVPAQSITLFVVPTGSTNKPPAISSGPTATPNPAQAGQAVNFTVGASDPDGDTLSYAWTFGDGTTGTGATPSHTYAAAGSYLASVTVTDTASLAVSGSVIVTVNAASGSGGGGGGTGGSGSGGSGSGGSGGSGGTTPTPITMTVSKIQGSMKFSSTGHDGCSLSGVIPNVPAHFDPTGQTLSLNVGGAIVSFALDSKGHGKSPNGTLTLKLKPSIRNKTTKKMDFQGGNVSFIAKMSKGTWATTWGLTATSTSASMPITVTIGLDGNTYQAIATVKYTPAKGSGKFKM